MMFLKKEDERMLPRCESASAPTRVQVRMPGRPGRRRFPVAGRVGRSLVAFALACALAPVPQTAYAESASIAVDEDVSAAGSEADAGASGTVSAAGSFAADAANPLDGLTEGVDYVADELLVTLSADASATKVEEVADTVEASLASVVRTAGEDASLASDGLSAGDVVVLQLDEGGDLADAAGDLLACDEVAAVQPNYLYDLVDDIDEPYAGQASGALVAAGGEEGAITVSEGDPLGVSLAQTAQFIPDDPAFSVADRCWQHARIGAYAAWSRARANGMAKVAVVDSGINASHEDFSGVIDTANAYNANTETYGIDAVADTVGHGSHVAGSIAAVANNSLGTAGVSFGAQIVPIKCTYTAGSGDPKKASTLAVAAGIRYAMKLDVQVINLSLGTTVADEILNEAVNDALAAGISLVAAAGNNVGENPYYPSDYDGVVSVTAIDATDAIASFSGHNEHKTIAAPGSKIYSLSSGGSASYSTLSGTSMAASIVSGAVCVLRVANPNLTAREIEQALYTTADDAGAAGRDPYYGWGILRLDKACQKVTADPVRGFTDMDPRDWYVNSDDFGWSVSMGYLRGYANSSLFGPFDGITRGQFATMLWRMGGQASTSSEAFDDVDYSQYYGEAIRWARATGVVHGYGGSNDFRPDAEVSRQELVCMLANYARQIAHLDTSTSCEKLDGLVDSATVASWARDSFGWCMDRGIVSGVEVGSGARAAEPESGAWRVSAACMVTSLMRDVLQ